MLAIHCGKGHSRTRRFAVPELHHPQAIQLLPHFQRVQTGVAYVGSLLLSSSVLPPFPPLPSPLFLFVFFFCCSLKETIFNFFSSFSLAPQLSLGDYVMDCIRHGKLTHQANVSVWETL